MLAIRGNFMQSKAFTLIELLVVIAIIGILSAIVLASLDSARNKGGDAATKGDLDGTHAQAELYYDAQTPINTYTGTCASIGLGGIYNMLLAAKTSSGAAAVDVTSAHTGLANTIECHDGSNGYAAEAPLKAGGYWCVDSTGSSTAHASGRIANGAVACAAG